MTERDIGIRSKADDPVASYWRNRHSSGLCVCFLQTPLSSNPMHCSLKLLRSKRWDRETSA
jgi:hypothetical protein